MSYNLHHYVIDWDKVTTLEDVKRLLAAMSIAYEHDFGIKDLVRLELKPRVGAVPL